MNHLDEGIIHAWLDGALDATQSAEIDAHVKSCAECAARVAEARGLIAASSRILTSLDDVPANVMPKAAPVATVRRRRSITPWLTGLAAAVVLVTLWRTGDVQQNSMPQINIPPVQITPVQSEPSLERVKEPALPVATAPAAPSTNPAVARRTQTDQAAIGNPAQGRVAGVAAAAGAAASTEEAFAAREMRRSEALKDNTSPVVGCYQIADQGRQEAVVTALSDQQPKAAVTAGAATRSRAVAPSAAPAPAMQKAAEVATTFTIVRLDSGNVVRVSATDSPIGTWQAITGDSARIAMKGRTTVVSPLTRVRCP